MKWLLLLWTVTICTLFTLFYEAIDESPLVKQLKYEVSLEYTRQTQSEWWNRIPPTRHYLGAQPLARDSHGERLLHELHIDAVLTLLEPFEIQGSLLNPPAYHRIGIERRVIAARDFRPLRFTEIDAGVVFLRDQTALNHTVYVHCKAGRGRSAAVFWAYLILNYKMTPSAAFTLLEKARPAVNINQYQRDAVLDYVKYQQQERFCCFCRVDLESTAIVESETQKIFDV